MTRLDEIRARLAAACGCGSPCFAECQSWAARVTTPDDRVFLLAEIERLTGEAAAERRKVERVGAVLSDNGCDCDCDHDFESHDAECVRCLACRMQAALDGDPLPVPPEVPDASVASEGADGLGSAPSTLADLYDDVPSNIADGDR